MPEGRHDYKIHVYFALFITPNINSEHVSEAVYVKQLRSVKIQSIFEFFP
ncbi:hypothetical protein VRK_15440 [Vibrio sp. MEBiC08052]|nr:hypothetical protein VRK_15440 [Vibrio sp. MEBiC08052]